MARIRSLLVSRFKTFATLVNSVQGLIEKNAAFEAELRELGLRNNVLSVKELREEIKKGLASLKGEGWLSEKESQALRKELVELG
jgi:hypothetical protein